MNELCDDCSLLSAARHCTASVSGEYRPPAAIACPAWRPADAALAALPDQQTIDAVAVGLAELALRAWLPTNRLPFELLLTLLGIPTEAEWALGVLETHHDGPTELVDALRWMKVTKGQDDGNSAICDPQ